MSYNLRNEYTKSKKQGENLKQNLRNNIDEVLDNFSKEDSNYVCYTKLQGFAVGFFGINEDSKFKNTKVYAGITIATSALLLFTTAITFRHAFDYNEKLKNGVKIREKTTLLDKLEHTAKNLLQTTLCLVGAVVAIPYLGLLATAACALYETASLLSLIHI